MQDLKGLLYFLLLFCGFLCVVRLAENDRSPVNSIHISNGAAMMIKT